MHMLEKRYNQIHAHLDRLEHDQHADHDADKWKKIEALREEERHLDHKVRKENKSKDLKEDLQEEGKLHDESRDMNHASYPDFRIASNTERMYDTF